MPVCRKQNGTWFYRKQVKLPDGSRERIFGTPTRNTKTAAEVAEREHVERTLENFRNPKARKEVPTLKEWFYGDADPKAPAEVPMGRFWTEWVVPHNKPSEQEAKISIYRHHLGPKLGGKQLDKVGAGEVSALRAALLGKQLSRKRVNNVLCVLSKVLRYAVDVEVIDRAPKIGLLKCERPEIEAWSFEEYGRLVCEAYSAGPIWWAAVLLAGEGGLRVGEVKALRWGDVDLIGRTLTVQRQIRHGVEGTPKGGKRRVVPITATLERALRSLQVVRTGYVVRNLDGTPLRDGQATNAIRRICRKAGLAAREWHALRHSFGTHLALLGMNPFRLQAWMGHARMEETLLYVHVAQAHPRPLPAHMAEAGLGEIDSELRALRILGARAAQIGTNTSKPWDLRAPRRGTGVALNVAVGGET